MKLRNIRRFSLHLFLFILIQLCLTAVAYPQDSDKGKIIAIHTDKTTVKRGETIRVRVEVQNLQRSEHHQLVVLNILDSAGKTIYDSHTVGQDIDFFIGYNNKKIVGPFTWTVPRNIQPGTYTLLVGYREHPWEPLIAFQGASWCLPVKAIFIK